ncbi:hypothetical protein K1720_07270 [Thermococcus argininiproducens]|uniref:Nucleoside recognition protein n=1 Tax=Thermococcus argininiproducens TaxID=2866384 RepID=A0A9E7M9S5_9EURY|nr:hypothetical protein [Thermococcus argininiproducens]USG99331.1 hypothetical protein K1720_07270 [Thermococcus argininiproducens]
MLSLIITSTEIAFSFLKRSVPGLLVGIFIAEILIEKGVINKFSPIGKPFVKLSNLPEECALAFATAFLNTRAGNAMLIDFYKEGKIGKKELYIASLMNAFPAMVRHWNSLVPVLLATLGTFGLLYFGILVLIGFIQTTVFAFAGKLLIKSPKQIKNVQGQVKNSQEPFKKVLRKALAKTKRHSMPILKTMVLATYITALLIAAGFFEYLTSLVKDFAAFLPLSPEEISVALSAMASSIAAYTLGANLLKAGLISEKALIRSLLLGSVLANITFLRVLIPYYVGLYGAKDGTKIMLISMATRSAIILCLILVMGVVL